MKRIGIILLALSVGFLSLCQPAFALTLGPGDSAWAVAAAPASFDGMSFTWSASWDSNLDRDLDYILHGPTGWSNTGTPTEAGPDAPSVVDLSIFQGENVVFEFHNAHSTTQLVLGDGFTYEFFNDATPVWIQRGTPIQTTSGNFSTSEPLKGDQFFIHKLETIVDNNKMNSQVTIRSDFQAAPVPEPGTLLLLSSGIVALAGARRKFKKK